MDEQKKCKKCGETKPISEFYVKKSIGYRCSTCAKCYVKNNTEVNRRTRERKRAEMYQSIVELLKQSGPLCSLSIAEKMDRNPAQIKYLCANMAKQGLLNRTIIVHQTSVYEYPDPDSRIDKENKTPLQAVDDEHIEWLLQVQQQREARSQRQAAARHS